MKKPEIKEIMGIKVNMSELKEGFDKSKTQALFGNSSPEASSLFKSIKPKPSLFGQNQ